jgi:catechol 2,3-dioxygenase-like lactoylglutathione lyase family enzyme
VRVLVRDIDSVLPWYVEKLGLRKFAENPHGGSGIATLRFKVDGNSVALATRDSLNPPKTPMLFTKKIGKIRNVLVARGVEVGPVERDRQGTRYFDIHDPEGNLIEFVEEA